MTTTFLALITFGVAISASLIIILIYNLRRQRKSGRLLTRFNKAAAEFDLSIAKQEMLRSGMIGFDNVNNKLLFLQRTTNKHDEYLIDIDKIKNCTVRKMYGTRKMNGDAYVRAIALQLNYKNGANTILLPFYNSAIDPIFEMREREEQAEEWQALLSTQLTEKRQLTEV